MAGYTICYKKDGKFVWLSNLSLSLSAARVHWQGALLAGSFAGFSMYLKPTPKTIDKLFNEQDRKTWLDVVARNQGGR